MPNKTTTAFSARKRLIVVAISACFVSAPAWSNPTAPQVVNGSASFNQAGKLLTVTNSNGAIINWNTFSIGANETTRFNQASANSSVLNRVLANDPSVLLGTLSSNGRVWLVNPAGIMVGQGARIDVAGFVASTLNVRNEDFLAGRLSFGATPNAGRIENHGQITTPSGGSVYLIAPAVENHGIINAPNGEVILAAGQTAQLIDTGTPGIKVDITGAEGNVTNLGAIVAEAGRIGMAGVLVKNSGTLNASSLVKEGGRIFLKASGDAYVDGAGRITATGTKGGSIEVLGNRVAVMDQARLDASGDTGGGAVLVGGDYQGRNPDVQNATITYFGPNASVKADATRNGDGGKVIVWADDTTRAYGNISARGGANGGNGGFVETSGEHYLDVSGIQVDARGVRGTSGAWLLDPNDISIISGSGAQQPRSGSSFLFAPGTTSSITDGTINATLNAGTNVKIKTSSNGTGGNGDILMTASAAILTSSPGRELELEAERNINLQGSIGTTSTGSLSVLLSPGDSGKVTTGNGNTLTLNGALVAEVRNGKSWDNSGTITLQGKSQIHLYDGISYATFNNLSGAHFNSSSSANFAFFSLNDLGTVNNNGAMAINTNSQSFETIFNQGATGTLNIADTNFLNLQNAVSLSGGVNLNASGALNINENHGTAASLNNLSFSGTGGTLSVGGNNLFPGKTANLTNVSAPNVALTVGSEIDRGVINVINGDAVFKSVALAGGGSLGAINDGTLGIASGNFSIPNGVTYTGNVGYFAAGDLSVNNPMTVPGALKLMAGWDGNIASPGTTGATGAVTISGFSAVPTTITAGTLSIDAGSRVQFVIDGGTAGLSSTGSIHIRTGSGGLTLPTGTSIAASGDVELAPIGNADMCIASGVACDGIFSIDPSILSRVSPTGVLILGRAVTDTSYTGTLTVKTGTTIPSSVINGSKLALNGYDVILEPNTSIGDSEFRFVKPLDILANRNLTFDGNINLGTAQDLLMKAAQLDVGSLTVNGTAISGGNITLNNPRGDITGTATLGTQGTLTVDANGGISLTGPNQAGTFVATNTGSGDIVFNNTGDFNLGTVANSATSGVIIIDGGNSITQTGNLTTSGGAISVTANTNLTMASTTNAQSNGGLINYEAIAGSVHLGLLNAGAGIVLVAAGENITDGNGALANNIKAGVALLVAGNADGGPGSIDVDTQVPGLFVDNSLVRSTEVQLNNPVTVRNSGSGLAVSVFSAPATAQLTITNDNTINVGNIIGATNTTIAATGASSDISVAQGVGTVTTIPATGASSEISVAQGVGTLLSAGNIALNAGRDINLGAGSLTMAGHDINFAAGNVMATNATISAGHDISAAVTGDLRLNGSGFTAGNDIFINMLGATSTLYLNDVAGLPRSFLWAQAPSTIHLDFPARAADGMVVNGVAVDPLTFAAAAGASGLFDGAAMAPAILGAGVEVAYGKTIADTATTTVAPTVVDTVVAAISASTTHGTRSAGPLTSAEFDANRPPPGGSGGTQGSDQIGGTEGTFGGSTGAKKDDKDDKNKTDKDTGLKKQADKPAAKKLATCS